MRALWDEVLGEQLLLRPRLSRILWNGRFLDYPLRATDVVRKLGPVELTRAMSSYLAASLRPKGTEETFEEWVTNRFGRRLFELFFRSYTEKVWGVPTSEIRAEWAAQRIKGLSFLGAARGALLGNRANGPRSLIGEFHYPRLGPGQMWEAMAREIEARGGEVRVGARVTALEVRGKRVEAGGERLRPASVISSLPLRTTVGLAGERAPAAVVGAARGLRYRDFLTVGLVVEGDDPFPDTWVYVHDPGVKVGRNTELPCLAPRDGARSRACLGLEYFCFEGDRLWNMDDEALVRMASRELEDLGLVARASVQTGHVVRVPKAYPMYDAAYAGRVAAICGWLERFENLRQVGRNGLHRYNNSDHSMLTAMRAVENLLEGTGHDIWAVNGDGDYGEEAPKEEQPYRAPPRTPAMAQPLADRGTALPMPPAGPALGCPTEQCYVREP